MKPTVDLPDDPALPGLAAIRESGLAAAFPTLDVASDDPIEMRLCGYTPGSRATLDVQTGRRRFAIKAYAADAEPEAALYRALGAAGFGEGGRAGARVPPLLAWEPSLRVLAIGWLEGPAANQLIKEGQGRRAGELAARWIWSAASAPVKLGPTVGVAQVLVQAGKSVAQLAVADRGLGAAAKAVAVALARTPPPESAPRLVHGTLYARHILDLGGDPRVPGVIDWQRFGQGTVEIDAGVFLATLTRLGRRHQEAAGEAQRAEEAFLAETHGLVERRTLRWYRAAALLHLASRLLKRDSPAAARPLVDEAGRLTRRAPVAPRRAALELVLRALSTRPATPAELDEIRRLLS
ncbi:MAG TPA: phosphotransferase [Gemmatimonadales bacterium]|nr:phosphotransferase [Gemmatimonadales bacterium]